jgi:CheY-like chemotaxis protein
MTSGLELRQECLAAGADGFLMKPFMPKELIDWLNNAIGPEEK